MPRESAGSPSVQDTESWRYTGHTTPEVPRPQVTPRGKDCRRLSTEVWSANLAKHAADSPRRTETELSATLKVVPVPPGMQNTTQPAQILVTSPRASGSSSPLPGR